MSSQIMLILPSNSDDDIKNFPQNHPSNFVTKLFEPINLGINEWEANLLEVSYPSSWANVEKDYTFKYRIFIKQLRKVDDIDGTIVIQRGFYASPSELLFYIGSQIDKILADANVLQRVHCEYDAVNNVSSIHTIAAVILLSCAETTNPMTMLGFEVNKMEEIPKLKEIFITSDPIPTRERNDFIMIRQQVIYSARRNDTFLIIGDIENRSTKPVQLQPYNHIFVEADFIEHINIGNTLAPIIGLIRVDHKSLQTLHTYSFPVETWLPLNSATELDKIRIRILQEDGTEIKFHNGIVTVRISLRPKIPIL